MNMPRLFTHYTYISHNVMVTLHHFSCRDESREPVTSLVTKHYPDIKMRGVWLEVSGA